MGATSNPVEFIDLDDTTISSSILPRDEETNPLSQTEVSNQIPDDRYAGGVYASLSGGILSQRNYM